MARTSNHYDKWLRRGNSINIQDMIMVLAHCTFSHCHVSLTKFHFNPICTFQKALTSIHYEKMVTWYALCKYFWLSVVWYMAMKAYAFPATPWQIPWPLCNSPRVQIHSAQSMLVDNAPHQMSTYIKKKELV